MLRLPPPTIQNDIDAYEEMRTRRIEVRGADAPSAESTQRMEIVSLDPGTHGNT